MSVSCSNSGPERDSSPDPCRHRIERLAQPLLASLKANSSAVKIGVHMRLGDGSLKGTQVGAGSKHKQYTIG